MPEPLNYYSPPRRRGPYFAVHRAGLILLVVLGIVAAAGAIISRFRKNAPEPPPISIELDNMR